MGRLFHSHISLLGGNQTSLVLLDCSPSHKIFLFTVSSTHWRTPRAAANMKSNRSRWHEMTTSVLCEPIFEVKVRGFAVVLCWSNTVSENHNLQWLNIYKSRIAGCHFWKPKLKNWTGIIVPVIGTQKKQRVELLQPPAINICMLAGRRPPQKMVFGYGTIQFSWWSQIHKNRANQTWTVKRCSCHQLDSDAVQREPAASPVRLCGSGKQRRCESLPILLCGLWGRGWALKMLAHSPKPKTHDHLWRFGKQDCNRMKPGLYKSLSGTEWNIYM